MIEKLAALIAVKLWEMFGPKIVELVNAAGQQLLDKIMAMLPVLLAAFGKQLADKLPDLSLPGLPILAEDIRQTASGLLPEDIDLPIVSDFGEKVLGFDLTDVLQGLLKGKK
jgi:hypothetical protein